MGANEKYEAAMHGGEYVPSVRDLRTAYVAMRYPDMRLSETRAEFDRFITKIRAESKAEALRDLANTSLETRKISKFQAAWIRGLAREYTQGPHKIVGAFATPETNKENQS